jgi:hypothetical protein
MNKAISKFVSISFTEQWQIMKALVLLSIFKIALKIFPIKKINKYFNWLMPNTTNQNTNQQQINQIAVAIKRVAFTLPCFGFTCLPQTLAFKFWLKQDADINIMIGVQRDETQQFVAHAWAEKNNEIIFGEQAHLNYVPIWSWQIKKLGQKSTTASPNTLKSLSY